MSANRHHLLFPTRAVLFNALKRAHASYAWMACIPIISVAAYHVNVRHGDLLQTIWIALIFYLVVFGAYFLVSVLVIEWILRKDADSLRRFEQSSDEQRGLLVGAVLTGWPREKKN